MLLSLLLLSVDMFAAYSTVIVEVDGVWYEINKTTQTASVVKREGNTLSEYQITQEGNYSGDIVIAEEVPYEGELYPVTKIGKYAMASSLEMTSVSIPSTITSIGEFAFATCLKLTEVTIPAGVKSVGGRAFRDCYRLKRIIVEEGNARYDSRDSCNAIIETATNKLTHGCVATTIPNSVTVIGNSAFFGCRTLGSIAIPENVESIGDSAFFECAALQSICIPQSVNSVGKAAFAMCTGMVSADLACQELGTSAFYGDSLLSNVILQEGVTTIGDHAIRGCKKLTALSLPNSLKTVKSYALSDNSLESITLPENLDDLYRGAFAWNPLVNVIAKNTAIKFTSGSDSPFTDRTLLHAMLYIPVDTWVSAVYDGSLYQFTNIKEMAASTEELSENQTYTLMNAHTYGYVVCNGAEEYTQVVKAFYNLDDSDPNSCWQIVTNGDKNFLYNIGTQMYAKDVANGTIELSKTPVAIAVCDKGNGVALGSDEQTVWNFVITERVQPDGDLPNSISRVLQESESQEMFFDLQGRRLSQRPVRGLYIQNGRKYVVR